MGRSPLRGGGKLAAVGQGAVLPEGVWPDADPEGRDLGNDHGGTPGKGVPPCGVTATRAGTMKARSKARSKAPVEGSAED